MRERVLQSDRLLGRSFLSPPFLACALLLCAGGIGLRPLMKSVASRYTKERIGLRRPLTEFNVSALKSFGARALPDHFPSPTEDTGTQDAILLALEETTPGSARRLLALLVTYYSDPADKVPHTPDVCYRQGGTIVNSITTTTVDVPGVGPGRSPVEVYLLDIQQPHTRGIVLYVFCANGDFLYDREQVRWRIGQPGDRYVYFSKIEVVSPYSDGEDEQLAIRTCKKLLSEALPLLVNEHFPADADLKGP